MSGLKIFIDNLEVSPVDENLKPPSISKSLQTYGAKLQSSSNRTFPFKVVADKVARSLIGDWWDASKIPTSGNSPMKWRSGRVEQDGVTLLSGNFAVTGMGGGKRPEYYNCIIFGTNQDWAKDMKTLLLREMDFGRAVYSEAEITNSWSVVQATGANEPIYPLVNFGKWKGPGTGGALNQKGYASAAVEDFRPQMFERDVVKRCFSDLGYSVSGDFFTDTIMGKVLTLACGNEFLHDETGVQYYSFEAEVTTPLTTANPAPGGQVDVTQAVREVYFDTINSDLSSLATQYPSASPAYTQFEPASEYSVNISGSVTCSVSGNVGQTNNIDVTVYLVAQSSSTETELGTGLFNVSHGTGGSGTDTVEFISENIKLDASEDYRCLIRIKNVTPGVFFIEPLYTFVDSMDFMMEHNKQILNGQEYNLAYAVFKQGLTQYDLIKGFEHTERLVIETDTVAKNVDINFDTTFFRGTTEDYTELIDTLQGVEVNMVPEGKSRRVLQFKSDSDEWVKQIEERDGGKLHASTYVLPEVYGQGDEPVVNPFFAATAHIRDKSILDPTTTADTGAYIPRIWSDSWDGESDYPDEFPSFEPRRLYWKGLVTTGAKWVFEGLQRGQVPQAFQVNLDDPDGTDPNLGFSSITTPGGEVEGKARQRWMGTFARLRTNFELDCKLILNSEQFRTMDFSRPKYLMNGEFVLNHIREFLPGTGVSSPCSLVLNTKPETEDYNALEDSQVNQVS